MGLHTESTPKRRSSGFTNLGIQIWDVWGSPTCNYRLTALLAQNFDSLRAIEQRRATYFWFFVPSCFINLTHVSLLPMYAYLHIPIH